MLGSHGFTRINTEGAENGRDRDGFGPPTADNGPQRFTTEHTENTENNKTEPQIHTDKHG